MTNHSATPDSCLAAIKALCQQYAHPGVNVGAHELASKILKLIEEAEGNDGNTNS